MPIPQFNPVRRGGKGLPASEVNRLTLATEQLARLSGSGSVGVQQYAGSFQLLPFIEDRFWARLTAYDSGTKAYAWKRLYSSAADTWIDDPVGFAGTLTVLPAYEVKDLVASVGATTGDIVELILGPDQTYFNFKLGGSGGGSSSLTVKEDDGIPTLTGITTLSFHDPDFSVAGPSPTATVSIVGDTVTLTLADTSCGSHTLVWSNGLLKSHT